MARKIGSRYVAVKVLGRGSCGTVWQGEGPHGPVALKLLREDLASDQVLVARFVQERTALTSLDHPNIVGIHDLVVDGSDLALVMDLVDGPDLRSHLEENGRALRPQQAVAIAADVADALAAAHAAGIVHRDVKPENILLDRAEGTVRARLADFGIARLVDSPRRTRATRIIGTPDYLAPEVIEGLQPTGAVDVYALATVLYEMLTGWTPFGGGHTGAVLRRHVTEPVAGIPGLPQSLARILSSCLSKAPAARLTARELGERLRAAMPSLAGLPAFEVPPPDNEPERYEPGRRNSSGVPASRSAGAIPVISPLVYGAEAYDGFDGDSDGTRDTHTNLLRPVFDDAPPVTTAAPRSHRGRPRGSALRRRRRTVALLAAAVTLGALGTGGWWFVSRDDDGAKQPETPVGSSPAAAPQSPGQGTGTPLRSIGPDGRDPAAKPSPKP